MNRKKSMKMTKIDDDTRAVYEWCSYASTSEISKDYLQ